MFFYLLKLFKKQPERETGVILSNPMEEKPKTKRPKVPKLKTDSEPKKEQVVPSIIEILHPSLLCFRFIYYPTDPLLAI